MMKQYLLLLVLYFLIIFPSFGQHNLLRFSHISSKEGLPHSLVFSFDQDQQGFIWVGTNNGLARYDGYNFRVFRPDPEKQNSISDKSVFNVHCDKQGNLWAVLQGKGLNRMELKTEHFWQYYPNNADSNAISGNEVRQIVEGEDGSLWFATNAGIDLYDPTRDNFRHFLPSYINSNSVPSSYIVGLAIDKSKNIWLLSNHGIGFLNTKTREVTSIGRLLAKEWLDRFLYSDLKIDKEGNLWFCGSQGAGLSCYNRKSDKLIQYLSNYSNLRNIYIDKNDNLYVYADKPINKLIVLEKKNRELMKFSEYPMFTNPNGISYFSYAEDKNDNIWITSTQGLERFNINSGLVHYRSSQSIPGAISQNNLVTSFIDKSENLWLSVYRLGIDKADLLQKPFQWYLSDPERPTSSLPANDITAIYEDRRGNIWIGTYGAGLTCYNPKEGTFRTLSIGTERGKLSYNAPAALYEDDQGRIWVGYYDGQLDRINPRTFQIEQFRDFLPKNNSYYLDAWAIRKILADKEGNLWFASSGKGLVELNKKTGAFIYHSLLYEKSFALNSFYRTAFIDKNDIVWLGTQNGGLIRYDRENRQFVSYKTNKDDNFSINNNTVYSIYEDSSAMWIGTAGGLNRFDKRAGKFYKYKALKELMQFAIFSIYPDKAGNLWMSTDHGVLVFNPETEKLKNYIESDGLPSNEFSTTGHGQLRSGKIFFGTPKGLISFEPSEININPYKAKPIITDLRVFNTSIAPGDSLHGRVLLKEHIWATKKLVFKHNENDFSIEFSALHFAAPEKIIYFYKLENYSDKWVSTDSHRRFANYTGIQPGTYIFRLKTMNSDGIPSDPSDEVELEIYIAPSFWQTWLFRITVALLVFIGIGLYVRQRLRGFKNQKIKLERMVRQRTRDLEEINVMLEEKQEEINIQHEELMSQKDHLEIANQKLTEQQGKIIEQNLELHKHRNNLEQLIQERTAELMDAKQKAEESDRLKSSFISNVSHEIRTPMNAIVGFSSLLRDNHFSEEELKGIYNIIITNGETLLVLINDILDLSFIQTGQLKLRMTNCVVNDFLSDIYTTHLPEVSKKPVELKLVVDKLPLHFTIQADVVRLRQVIDNLVGNATKFTNAGSLTFGVKSIDKEILFFVSDTGIGISSEVGDKIFGRFTKLEDDQEAIFRGTGLGLAICKSIVELWGGRIWYESQLKVGTTFYFTYPIHMNDLEKSEVSSVLFAQKEDGSFSFKDKIILVAEDEAFNYQVIAAYFKGSGAVLHWVKNGQEVIDFVSNTKPDIILMDIKMPVMDGRVATKQLKLTDPSIKIVAQTAYARQEEIDEFLTVGFDGYIVKPYRKDDLLAVVQRYIG